MGDCPEQKEKKEGHRNYLNALFVLLSFSILGSFEGSNSRCTWWYCVPGVVLPSEPGTGTGTTLVQIRIQVQNVQGVQLYYIFR
jgi:hypothetical protein